TFRKALEDIRRRFNIDRVIVVADRGMISNGLIEEIDKAGLSYIFGVKMRRSKIVEAVLNQPGDYEEVEENLKVKEVLYEGERYVICFNPFQAERDRIKREEIVKNLTKKLKQGPKSLVGNRGHRRYLSMQKADVKIDQEKMASEVKYDGKYVLRTNTKLTNREVAQSYQLLWKVERAFRELKSGLDLRPIYHYTDARVKGHIMICFLALVMETALCRKLKEIGSTFSYAEILEDLKEIRAVELTVEGKRFLARTEMMGNAYDAFKALKIRPPDLLKEIA
ncbi:transposase, partial [Mesotoga sp. Brook.08.YT.4.2.5.2.]